MNSAIFTTARESFQVSQIIYAGPVTEIPASIRKENGSTHSFKILTPQGPVYCYYRSEEAARSARGALGAMLRTLKPKAWSSSHELIDPARVISFGNVFAYKEAREGMTHAFVVTVDTADEKGRRVWLGYKSEDHAKKGRRAMFAAVHAVNGSPNAKGQPEALVVDRAENGDTGEASLPF